MSDVYVYYVVSHDGRGVLKGVNAQVGLDGGARGAWSHGNYTEVDNMRYSSLDQARDAVGRLRKSEQGEVSIRKSTDWWSHALFVPYGQTVDDLLTLDDELVLTYGQRLFDTLQSLAEEAEYHVKPSTSGGGNHEKRVNLARTKIHEKYKQIKSSRG